MSSNNDKKLSTREVSYNPFKDGRILSAVPSTGHQREILATVQLEPSASIAFNEVIDLSLKGVLQVEALQVALSKLQERHAILRSVFSADGAYVLVKEKMPLPFRQLSGDAQTLLEARNSEVVTPFDLLHGPCFRATLVQLNAQEAHLVWAFHHVICDGWSLAILLTELSELYNASVRHENLVMSDSDSFIDYAGEIAEHPPEVPPFWLSQFKTLPKPLEWHDRLRPAYRTYQSARYDMTFKSEWTRGLKQFAAQNGCSLYSVLMAGFSWELSKLSGSQDLVVGMASAAQANLGRPQLVGHLVSLLPLRLTLANGLQFKAHLAQVKQGMLQAFAYPDLAYGELLKALSIPRDPSRVPLVSVVFNIDQQNSDQGLSFTGIKAHYETVPRTAENFELFVNVVSRGDHLSIECQYNTDLLSDKTVAQIFTAMEESLGRAETLPALSVQAKSIITAAVPAKSGAPADADTTKKILRVWSNILGKQLSGTDNFFSQGGHSLLAVEAARALSDQLGHKLAAKHIFSHPSANELAALVSTLPKISTNLEAKKQIATTGPLSPAQWQAWYLEQVNPGTTMHNLPAAIRLKMPLDVAKLSQAFRVLMSRQPALRLSVTSGHQPVQMIADTAMAETWPDLTVVSTDEDELVSILDKWGSEKISTTEAPLMRARLLKLGAEDFVLFFMVHHLIWDGWSFDIFFAELDLIYSSLLTENKFNLAPLAMGPIEIAEEARAYKTSTQGEADRHYWKEKLKAPLPKLEWAQAKPRPRLMSHDGGTVPFTLPRYSLEQIKLFAGEHATTPFVIFLTAFARLVMRHSQLSEAIIGMPVRNRESTETQNVMGYFVNSVALRLKDLGELDFVAAMKSTEKVLREALEHHSLSFTHVLEELSLPRDPSRSAVFQAFFSFQDVSNRDAKLNGVSYKQINIDKASTHTDLDVWIKLGRQAVEGAFEFRRDLFDANLIEQWSQEYSRDILQHISGSRPCFVVEQVESFAQLTPHKTALRMGTGQMTYAELWSKVQEKSLALQKRGATPGKLIGVSMSRSSEMLITLLAIMRTGAAYVPLDPMFPQERLEHMLNTAQPLLVVTGPGSQLRYPSSVTFADLQAAGSFTPMSVTHEAPMYVIFTSGSTGTPKGVEVSFAAVENFLRSMSEKPGLKAHDRLLAVTTLSFDIAVLELYLPMTVGAELVIASSSQVMDGEELTYLLNDHDITFMQATPVTWRLLYGQGWKGKRNLTVLCGGEAFPFDLAQKLIADCRAVWNMYGPTETTVWSTCRHLMANEKITIGGPIAKTTLLVMNEQGVPVATGEVGELWIGGAGVANGYFNRPDLTQERFVNYQGQRYYRTGDLARQIATDNWECLGRIDTQVKIRGYRIELEEIEIKLRAIAGITDAVVTVQSFSEEDRRLIAFVCGSFKESQVKEELSHSLPHYMIPQHYAAIDSVPLTPNGKVDRKGLPAITVSADTSTDFTDLRSLWKHYLNVPQVQDHDDFFALGGNSLMAVEIIAAIQKSFGVDVGLAHLIQHSTFAEFNELVTQVSQPKAFTALVAISETTGRKPMFLFHGVGGNVMNYVVFTQALKDKRSLYGVQSVGVDGKNTFITTIEGMAEAYLREIRLIQPHGPYLLAGGSMGGTIAFEVALLLQRLGEKVERVIMFDTFGPDVTVSEPDPDESAIWPRIKSSISYRTRGAWLKIKRALAQVFNRPVPLDVILHALEATNYRALRHYRPGVFDGDITLIRAQMKPRGWYSDPHMGWHKVVRGKIETFYLDGQHHNFIENPKLAELLKKLL